MYSDLTKKTYTEIVADRVEFYAKMELGRNLVDSVKFRTTVDPLSQHVAVCLVAQLMKCLVKNEEIIVEKDSEQTIEARDSALMTLVRPVDHLLEFLARYSPFKWLENLFLDMQRGYYERHNVVHNYFDKHIHNHYHCIPWDMKKSGYEARFLMWSDGTYYEGTPEEWGDLKAIRDRLLETRAKGLNWREDDVTLLHHLRHSAFTSENKKRRYE